jgi:glutamate-ammonia-ligase adenylyltransferase
MDKLPDPRWRTALDHSRYLTNLLAARPMLIDELAGVWTTPLAAGQLLTALEPPATDLRRLRQRAMAHIALRDLCGLAPLAEVVESMTLLADVTTNFALDHYHRQLAATYGEPLDKAGRPQRLLIIGMGKLGGRELNVSSDVDYIFVYPEDGDTAGPRKSIENYDFFTRLGKRDQPPSATSPPMARFSASTCACAPTAIPARWSARSTRWKTTSSPRAANGSATPGSRRAR